MEQIKLKFKEAGFDLTEDQYEKLNIYFKELVETNKVMNLTAITDLEGVYIKHFLDSLFISKCVDLKNKLLCDIGSGAGFPSIPLKILEPSLEVWIVDALNKRIEFLKSLCEKLKIKVNLVHNRAENFCDIKREQFDFVCARAVARLNVLLELCVPLVKVNGYFLAMKSNDYLEELKEAKKGIKLLGAEVEETFEYQILVKQKFEYRNIIKIKKIEKGSLKYPREFRVIKKKPL